jgi:hypothetical protein
VVWAHKLTDRTRVPDTHALYFEGRKSRIRRENRTVQPGKRRYQEERKKLERYTTKREEYEEI